MPRMTRVFPLAVVIGVILVSSVALAQDADWCLNNADQFAAPAGSTYSDAGGVWVCEPNNPEATSGGWVRVRPAPPTSAPSSRPAATPESAPGRSPRNGLGPFDLSLPLLALLGIVGALAVGLACLALGRQLQPCPLKGWLVLDRERRDDRS